jgi:hypothetical protein
VHKIVQGRLSFPKQAMTKIRALTLADLFCCFVLACRAKTAIWVMPGSTLRHLEFGIADTVGGSAYVSFGVLRVYECGAPDVGSGAAWALSHEPTTSRVTWPNRITYGATPPGFHPDQGPQPLHPGCYRATILGTGRTQFVVRPGGEIASVTFGVHP